MEEARFTNTDRTPLRKGDYPIDQIEPHRCVASPAHTANILISQYWQEKRH
jgi:hypothetical protein